MTADTTPADRMRALLADPDARFTAEQLVWFIQFDREARGDDPEEPDFRDLVWKAGYEAGYQARVAEENRSYRDAVEDAESDPGLRQLIETVDARRAADRAARLPRPGDFQGRYPLTSKEAA